MQLGGIIICENDSCTFLCLCNKYFKARRRHGCRHLYSEAHNGLALPSVMEVIALSVVMKDGWNADAKVFGRELYFICLANRFPPDIINFENC